MKKIAQTLALGAAAALTLTACSVSDAAPAGESTPPTPTPTSSETVTVPDLMGMERTEALAALEEAGFTTSPAGNGTHVVYQAPSGGIEALPGAYIGLIFGEPGAAE